MYSTDERSNNIVTYFKEDNGTAVGGVERDVDNEINRRCESYGHNRGFRGD